MVKLVAIDDELEIPKDVDFKIDNKVVTIKGKKGSVTKDFGHAKLLDLTFDPKDRMFRIHAEFPRRNSIALASTIKNIVINMIDGAQKEYTYKMKIVYSHFPITVVPPAKGSDLILIKNFIGERAPRKTHSIGEVKIVADKEEVVVSGCDKEFVGQTCANIQKRCSIKKKDKRTFQDGVYVYQKSLGDEVFWSIK